MSRQKRIPTDEQRDRRNDYARRYRAEHPDRVRQWRINHALNVASRIQREGGEDA